MEYEAFIRSVQVGGSPPEGLGVALKALWYAANDDWQQAHDLVQQEEGQPAAAVHAFLHRKEGDLSNARYWYRLAGRGEYSADLESEWVDLVRELTGSTVDPD